MFVFVYLQWFSFPPKGVMIKTWMDRKTNRYLGFLPHCLYSLWSKWVKFDRYKGIMSPQPNVWWMQQLGYVKESQIIQVSYPQIPLCSNIFFNSYHYWVQEKTVQIQNPNTVVHLKHLHDPLQRRIWQSASLNLWWRWNKKHDAFITGAHFWFLKQ
jgi:hypothetical protein